jgi:quercetin dioxygenase-like cupin family protein
MKYVRLFAGPDGESHFEDVTVEFDSAPAHRFPVSEWQPVERMRFLSFPPDHEPQMHRAPARLLHILITGSWTMQASDGETRHFKAGDVILVEDTTGKGHLTSITSEGATLVARIQLPG